MSKAITGAAMIAGAVGMGALMFALASTGVGAAALPFLGDAMMALASSGIAMEAAAIAGALTSNRGMAITTRQAAAQRQIIYGMQRVGGVEIYRSTTGSSKDQFNYVIVLAGHQCWGIESLYLDGRKVFFESGSDGERTYNGITFGGSADSGRRTGPGGQLYSFQGLVYCEMRDGTQSPGDVITGLTANDGNWAASAAGTPYVGGCCYVYLKIEYDPNEFPAEPEIRFTVYGKPVYDPRSGETAWSCNTALIAADILTDPVFGLGDATVNEAQLIAAANVCDEQVDLANPVNGATESRYTCHTHYDTGTGPGDALASVMSGMAGRLSRIGGEWYIWPAYWQGPSFSFDEKALTAEMQWDGYRPFSKLINRVTGTYTAANYPYSVAGNLYDSNGFYDGTLSNTFPFAFQPTNYPQYQEDALHGYASDEYLNEDSGVSGAYDPTVTYAAGIVVSYNRTVASIQYSEVYVSLVGSNLNNTPGPGSAYWANAGVALPRDLSLNTVLSIAQAQRVAKITLLRNRQQGSGTFEMNLTAWQMQPCDVMNFSFANNGWADKLLEINSVSFKIQNGSGEGEAPSIRATFGVNETDPSVYEWSTTEELSVYDVPQSASSMARQPAAPTNVTAISSAATALVAPDGIVTARIELTWDTPLDGFVTQLQMQYQLTGATAWSDGGLVDVSLNLGFMPVVAGQEYNVRIRSLRANGAVSDWVELEGITAGMVLSILTQDGYGIGSLIGEAYSAGGAAIICEPFTALVGQLSLSLFPGGAYTITTDGTIGGAGGAIQQLTLYYVYWNDPTYAGGNVTPIATTNKADFLGKLGVFLIDSIVTPFASATGSIAVSYPTAYSDLGSRSTSNPTALYLGGSGSATVSATESLLPPFPTRTSSGSCTWSGFSGGAASYDRTLSIEMLASIVNIETASGGSVTVTATMGGTPTTLETITASTSESTYTFDVPSGTDISSLSVNVTATPGTCPADGDSSTITARIYSLDIQ